MHKLIQTYIIFLCYTDLFQKLALKFPPIPVPPNQPDQFQLRYCTSLSQQVASSHTYTNLQGPSQGKAPYAECKCCSDRSAGQSTQSKKKLHCLILRHFIIWYYSGQHSSWSVYVYTGFSITTLFAYGIRTIFLWQTIYWYYLQLSTYNSVQSSMCILNIWQTN